MDLKNFLKLYKELNPRQKLAVDTVEGPVMVVAGPGTGKTKTLTLRIANILKETQADPENILALTFTEAAAATMRRRLAEIIGAPAYAVAINTFHGFCNGIIKNYPEYFPRIIGSQNINEVEQINIVDEAIFDLNLKDLKPFGNPSLYVRDILKAINDLKKEGITPQDFEKINEKEQEKFETDEDVYHTKGVHKGKMKGKYLDVLKFIKKTLSFRKFIIITRTGLARRSFMITTT